ncbi:UNVERIFIED_CONTAM: hypothetical protein Sradi_3967700 [Sesamum radiatum]|uniref:Reverse transcriptase zinc-binding domain-containing protein n=1 Tax=Sesamum radiatum TaxID=300843 RepID=A0AAW2PJN0_SESRA
MKQQLEDVLAIRLENKHKLYVGFPTMAFRSKRALLATLKDCIWRRIQGWHEKTLSQAGKAILIQTGPARPSLGEVSWLLKNYYEQARIPNKVKVFVWRAIRNILPSMSNLQKRKMLEVADCPLCGYGIETLIHTFLRCTFARKDHSSMKAPSAQLSSWKPPPMNFVKLNSDGSILNGGHALGIGVIARNMEERCLAWLSLKLDRKSSVEMAEAFAAQEAVQVAIRQQWR